ncbi:glycosyltransferase family 4 protein [Serinicoccus profundi]|uniref:glycosyltransferase family 4 protein n=1 Tax=Serinicoccus profundi TaxID=1078471 RepID=UPI000255E84B|nr:glycosyltransferase family 4 protein [Serinicoccus profundi]
MTTPRLMYAVTAPISALIFLEGQLRAAREAGFDVHVLCGSDPSGRLSRRCAEEGATLHEVEVTRTPSLRSDARAFLQVAAALRRVRPQIMVAGTPKMSLLALACGSVLRVPHRIYLCHGLRFEGASGLRRTGLTRLELLLSCLAHHVVAVSPSVAQGLRTAGAPDGRVTVLGSGSPNGVDLEHFQPPSSADRASARDELGLRPEGRVLAFVGRLTGDKGLSTLVALATALGNSDEPETGRGWLLVVGEPEPHSARDQADMAALLANPRVVFAGHQDDMRVPYKAADVLVLPTRREGLPTVVIEAAAMQIPTVAYRATGTVDAVMDGETGLLVTQGDVPAFVAAAHLLVSNERLRDQLGIQARERVERDFSRPLVWRQWTEYLRTLVAHAPPVASRRADGHPHQGCTS